MWLQRTKIYKFSLHAIISDMKYLLHLSFKKISRSRISRIKKKFKNLEKKIMCRSEDKKVNDKWQIKIKKLL